MARGKVSPAPGQKPKPKSAAEKLRDRTRPKGFFGIGSQQFRSASAAIEGGKRIRRTRKTKELLEKGEKLLKARRKK